MASLLRFGRRALGTKVPSLPQRNFTRLFARLFARFYHGDFSTFQEGDRVIIHGNKKPILTKPLRHGERTDLSRGYLEHSAIIGRRPWDPVQAYKGREHRISHPTLEEYIHLTPRQVTPIYAADANLIVSLLDLHTSAPSPDDPNPPKLEILEAGTGHGSLTLHLARAINAANPHPPSIPAASQVRVVKNASIRPLSEDEGKLSKEVNTAPSEDPVQRQWDEWRARRGAVIHTVDASHKFSAHAEKIVRGFRRGIYAGNVDFHVGLVEDWIADQLDQRRSKSSEGSLNTVEPFLSHVILDMPSAHQRIPHVAPVLRRDGILAVFMPSVTQIGDCVQLIRQQRLPFVMDRVVELGMGISSGRFWDVRMAVKKSRADPSTWTRDTDSEASDEEESQSESAESESENDDSVLVCRPKVGLKVAGGGFVGFWRRIEDR